MCGQDAWQTEEDLFTGWGGEWRKSAQEDTAREMVMFQPVTGAVSSASDVICVSRPCLSILCKLALNWSPGSQSQTDQCALVSDFLSVLKRSQIQVNQDEFVAYIYTHHV